MGLTNTFATLPGFIGPAVVGVITYRNVSAACFDELTTGHNAIVFLIWLFSNIERVIFLPATKNLPVLSLLR